MLKLFACLMMLLDHIGYYFASSLPVTAVFVLRTAGRLAMPIFAWYIARGYSRTRNPVKYFIRITSFALISEILLRLVHDQAGLSWPSMNILVTFALAIVLIAGYHLALHSYLDMLASLQPVTPAASALPAKNRYDVRVNLGGIELHPRTGLIMGSLMIIAAIAATVWLNPDYSLYGIFTVAVFYIVQDRIREEDQQKRSLQMFILLNAFFLLFRIIEGIVPFDWAVLQCFSIAAVPLFSRISEGRRPSWPVKYAFYLFYPLHIIILVAIRTIFV